MSFAAPGFLVAGVLAALAVIALHFLARQRPRAAPFPTARFIPERMASAPSRALRPTDLLLMLLRALAVMLLAAAFAGPTWNAPRQGIKRVVLADRSRAVASAAELRDSIRTVLRDGDVLVVFDSSAHLAHVAAQDSAAALAPSHARGSLSAALVAAQQGRASLAASADSIELVIVSPLAREEWDAATHMLRANWVGVPRLVRIAIAPPEPHAGRIAIRGAADDPLITGGLARAHTVRDVRVARDASLPEDSAWATRTGGVLVRWPRALGGSSKSAGALVMGDDVTVYPFSRGGAPAEGRAVAWWNDGAVAATERAAGDGCIRNVSIGVPAIGDLVLRASFRRIVAGLFAPCGGERSVRALDDSLAAIVREPARPPRSAFDDTRDRVPPLARWFLVAAAMLLLAEPLLRRRSA